MLRVSIILSSILFSVLNFSQHRTEDQSVGFV